MEVSWAWILSFIPRIDFLILKSAGLASSAISSSDKIHLLISSYKGERGDKSANNSLNESDFSSSLFERS